MLVLYTCVSYCIYHIVVQETCIIVSIVLENLFVLTCVCKYPTVVGSFLFQVKWVLLMLTVNLCGSFTKC